MMNNGGFDLWYQVRRLADLDPVQIDGWVFRLHYWVTSTAIFAASAVAFAKQYFGDPIECIFVSTYLPLMWICISILENTTFNNQPNIVRKIFLNFLSKTYSLTHFLTHLLLTIKLKRYFNFDKKTSFWLRGHSKTT